MQLRWSHAVVKVRDLDLMVDFYSRVLGFEVADRGDLAPGGPAIVFMSQVETDHHQIAFLPAGRGDDPPNSLDHMAFRVGGLDDVREMKERVEKDGRAARPPGPVTHGNAWSVYFQDPEGNGIEVFCDTPWHVAQPQLSPWDPSQTNEEVMRATEAAFSDRAEFRPFGDYVAERAAHFAKREGKS